jgi:nucleolar protein 15
MMSTRTTTKKRKSADGTVAAVKKVKTTRSADRPAPLKSALKKAKPTTVEDTSNDDVAEEPVETLVAPQNHISTSSTTLTPDQTAALLAGFSSDEEGSASEDEAGIAVSTLPKAPTVGAIQKRIKGAVTTQKNNSTAEDDPERTPGVVYIGRIPHGFFEHQMLAYFSQFGEILHLRLMRNHKTGQSQHYGFIEFASAAVADIVCKTMDKYLLFNHILQVKRVPMEQVNEKMWRVSSRRAKNVPPRNRLEGSMLKRGATRDVWETRVEREQKKRAEKAEKLKEMGYDFDMPAVKAVDEVPVKPKATEEVDGVENEDGPVVDSAPHVEKVSTERTAAPTVVEEEEVVTISKKRSAKGKPQTSKKVIKKVKA